MKDQNNEKEKLIDLELLFFYLIVSIFSFVMYMSRYPFIYMIKDHNINWEALFSLFSIDIILFLSLFIPYFIIIVTLIFFRLIKKIKFSDNIMIILFFPLFSFFTKGMSLMQVYSLNNLEKIVRNDFAFFAFILIGPTIVFTHKIVVLIKGKISSEKKVQ